MTSEDLTCHDVFTLIHALPLAELRPQQLETVEHHARDCAGCRAALTAEQTLTLELRQLPEPTAPTTMAAAILTRTAQHTAQRTMAASAEARQTAAKPAKDRYAWAAHLVGILIVLGAQTYRWLIGESTLNLVSPLLRNGLGGLIHTSQGSPAVLVLTVGLLLCITGLFALLRTPSRSPSSP